MNSEDRNSLEFGVEVDWYEDGGADILLEKNIDRGPVIVINGSTSCTIAKTTHYRSMMCLSSFCMLSIMAKTYSACKLALIVTDSNRADGI